MEQRIEQPDQQDLERISILLAYSSKMAMEVVSEPLDASLTDLQRLQAVADTIQQVNADSEQQRLALQALGMSFGQVLATQDKNYDWWMINDDDGRDPCLRYQQSELLIFPQTIISKRAESGDALEIAALYNQITEQLQDVVNTQLKN